MSIRFACGHCGHPIEVDDRLAGLHGRCKHCGHETAVPTPEEPAEGGGLRLRPLETETPGDDADPRLAAGSALRVRPLAPGDVPVNPAVADLDEPEPADAPAGRHWWSGKAAERPPYSVLDPDRRETVQARRFRLNPHYELRLARFAARVFRTVRDWLYVISLGFLAVAVIGFALKNKPLLHAGAVGVVATNVGMLVAGLFYLVVLPFRDSLPKGLGTLLLPPYAVYYWFTHWPQMRKPVVNTLRSFTPILLVGLAYLLYEEAPVIEREVEQIEKAVEKGERSLGIAPGSAPAPAAEPTAPGAVERAEGVVKKEAEAVEELAKPPY